MGRVLLGGQIGTANSPPGCAKIRFAPITAHTIYKARALQGGKSLKVAAPRLRLSSRKNWELGTLLHRLCQSVPVWGNGRVRSERQPCRYSDDVESDGAEKKCCPLCIARVKAIERTVARDGWGGR